MAGAAALVQALGDDGAAVGFMLGEDLEETRRGAGRALVALASCSTAWNGGRSWLLRRAPVGFGDLRLCCIQEGKEEA